MPTDQPPHPVLMVDVVASRSDALPVPALLALAGPVLGGPVLAVLQISWWVTALGLVLAWAGLSLVAAVLVGGAASVRDRMGRPADRGNVRR